MLFDHFYRVETLCYPTPSRKHYVTFEPPLSIFRKLKQDEAATGEFSRDIKEAQLQSELQFKLEQESREEEVKSKEGVSLQTAEIFPDTPTSQTDDVFTPKALPPVTSRKIDSGKKEADWEGGEFKEIKRKAKKVKSTSTFQHLPLVVDLNPTPIKVTELEKKLTEANKEICELVISKKEMQKEIDIFRQENLSLSHLLSQAELRKKADMVQEIEGLNLEKVEMAEELERMNEAIEQERTRAKNLRIELQRFQNRK